MITRRGDLGRFVQTEVNFKTTNQPIAVIIKKNVYISACGIISLPLGKIEQWSHYALCFCRDNKKKKNTPIQQQGHYKWTIMSSDTLHVPAGAF